MDDQSTHQVGAKPDFAGPTRRGTVGWFSWASMFLLCYVLSIFPAAKLQEAKLIPPKLFDTIYAPILFLCDKFDLWQYEKN